MIEAVVPPPRRGRTSLVVNQFLESKYKSARIEVPFGDTARKIYYRLYVYIKDHTLNNVVQVVMVDNEVYLRRMDVGRDDISQD